MRKVIVKKLALVVEGMPDKELDLTGDLTRLKDQKFKIKEGIPYKIRIDFIVQREIVHGLKYIQKTSRKGIPGTYCTVFGWHFRLRTVVVSVCKFLMIWCYAL